MSLDPLNVGLSKTWEENLVIAFSWVYFLVDDERAFILHSQSYIHTFIRKQFHSVNGTEISHMKK